MNRQALAKRGLYLGYITAGLIIIEAVAAVGAGISAGSIALIGFGLDGLIGTVSSGVFIRRFRLESGGQGTKEDHTAFERRALFAAGIAFFLLALYVLNEAGSRFYYKERPEVSFIGLALSAFCLISLPPLSFLAFRTAKRLESRVLRANVTETAVYASIAFVLLLGLGLYAWRNWWWADPAAALIMIPFIIREGLHAIEESKGTAYGAGAAKTGS